ncbi:MAG: flagellar hook-associated protein FlgK [candidate division Zixibacteria bacterium]|nr:flagellar hook-associated protein FlgK [candidate division Zixibacteria bacterium]
MAGLMQALETGKRSLLTTQLQLQTIGHNIANVNTPGFSRQRVTIRATRPSDLPIGSIGTGIEATDIQQIKDAFLIQQYRKESESLGEWQYKEKVLSQIETLFNEPGDNSISALLNDFWSSWSDLSTDMGNRTDILAKAESLSSGFYEMADQLNRLSEAIDREIDGMTGEINQITTEIASLNHQINSSELGGQSANDLRDRRDLLVDDLSGLVDVNAVEQSNGSLMVTIGAMAVVNDDNAVTITSRTTATATRLNHDLVWENTDVELKTAGGELKGMLDMRDKVIPEYMAQLDQMAQTIVVEVNQLHRTGYGANGSTGLNFFNMTNVNAMNMKINPLIVEDTSRIAASASGEPGDRTIALAIADLQNQDFMSGNTATLSEYYASLIGTIGVDSKEAQSYTENYTLLLAQVDNARQSVQGVSLDEEMINLVKFQQAYDAAARVITAVDEALDTLIKGTGVVGR